MPVLARVITSSAGTVSGTAQVALAAVLERRQVELDLVAELLAGPEPRAAQVERLHGVEPSARAGS